MKGTSVLMALAALLGSMAPSIAAQSAPAVESASPVQDGFVPTGTRVLVRLDDAISTKAAKPGTPFEVHTLEPLSTPDGVVLQPGAEIRGHVDKVDQAHQTGRARIWLTFDDVRTPSGWRPLVAFVSDVPGVHSLRVVFEREGAIEARNSRRQEQAEAAAAGAFVGAAPGVAAHNGKDAAIGAAAGAVTAFMLSSGLGQELTLEKNTKLELSLDHPLYLGRN
ncbi:MAG TPA: hypothetical protein VLY23_17410 [Candidatus Acidoferrum sp.]|nr:hypothetical protein [Candidatus Acidoferrum sp.]